MIIRYSWKNEEYSTKTILCRLHDARYFLVYLENNNVFNTKDISHQMISNYILSEHFENRKIVGISAEIIGLRKFISYLEDRNLTSYSNIHFACITKKNDIRHIVTTYNDAQVSVLLESYHDISCVILAPSTMHGSVKNRKVKNDKMDAFNIATNLKYGSYKTVHVPTEHDNEIKEYIGLREDVIISRKRIKQQISALALRHEFRYEGKNNWTIANIKWLETINLPEIVRETLNEYLKVYDYLNECIEKYDERIEEFSHEEEYEEPVSKISCFKGINTLSAMKIHVSVSDFQCFPAANAFMANLGMLPGENSSAEKHSNTPITKMGNAMVRNYVKLEIM